MYRPTQIDTLDVAIKVYKKKKEYISGSPQVTFIPIKDPTVMCNFKSYGGTETMKNNILAILDTATITTWYRPDITSDCIIEVLQNGKRYEIKNEPENFGLRNQYMQFKVERLNPNG